MELINYKFTCHPKCLSVWAREVSLQQTEVVLTERCGVGGPTHVLLYSLLGGSAHFRADGPPPIHAYFLPHSKYSRTFLLQMVDTSLLACLREFTSLAIKNASTVFRLNMSVSLPLWKNYVPQDSMLLLQHMLI